MVFNLSNSGYYTNLLNMKKLMVLVSAVLTNEILELRRIEAMLKLAQSENSKIVFAGSESAPLRMDMSK